MKFSRRNFIKLGGISALAAQGFSGSVFGQTRNSADLLKSSRQISTLVGTDFYIVSDRVQTTVKLMNVKDFPHKTVGGESYTMEFKVPQRLAKEDTYHVWHPQMGNFDLFMTEGRNGRQKTLMAIINRL